MSLSAMLLPCEWVVAPSASSSVGEELVKPNAQLGNMCRDWQTPALEPLTTPWLGSVASYSGFQGLVVKNTFFDVEPEGHVVSALAARRARSCPAEVRYVHPAGLHVALTLSKEPALSDCTTDGSRPTSCAASSYGDLDGEDECGETAQSQLCTSLVVSSIGAANHGIADADGQPTCLPCAWFYKASGCLNGPACRYCHLCPEGELRNRKKQKITRYREQEKACNSKGTGARGH